MSTPTSKAPTGSPGWLTREEAAERAEVSKRTIDRWLKSQRLTRYRIGHIVLIDAGELNEALEPKTEEKK